MFEVVLRIGTRQQFGKVQIALLILHQQHHAGSRSPRSTFQHNFSAQQGFDALFTRPFVKLDASKEVVEVGNGERTLPIACRCCNGIVNAGGSIDHGKFGMQA